MAEHVTEDFPLFPLGLVALPSELVPLHIFEARYRTMIEECMEREIEFGIVWMTDEELKSVGCACEIDRVVERMPDGRLNIVVRGTRIFRLVARQDDLPYPAATVEFLEDRDEQPDRAILASAREIYAELVQEATDEVPEPEQLEVIGAYQMAASVDFGPDAKQGLLELRSENARLELVTRLLRAALKRLDFTERAQARARSNGKVHFG
jgi:Lon protease-like protein